MATYRLTEVAKADIRGHWHFVAIERHSPNSADKLLDQFFEKFELFAQFPEIGAVAAEHQDIYPGMRFFPVGSYVIYYRHTEKKIVEILHVFRGEQDAGAELVK
jgi:plasmid stabilization system protein ParE